MTQIQITYIDGEPTSLTIEARDVEVDYAKASGKCLSAAIDFAIQGGMKRQDAYAAIITSVSEYLNNPAHQ